MASKLIWIVDDEDQIREDMGSMIRRMGFEFQEFTDARDAAKALLDGDCPDLMCLDMSMPVVSGLQFLQFVRGRSTWDQLPILMLTQESSDESVESAIRLGADGYVFKPLDFEELQIALRTATEARRMKKETGQLGPWFNPG
jgi:DNA-binding response OmpR family regulator